MNDESLIPRFTEFETKYRTELDQQMRFKTIVEDLPGLEGFKYAQGPDTYYTKPDGSFGRYRRGQFPWSDKFAQWTRKQKRDGVKNNVQRFESNWRVDSTPQEEIHAGALNEGYQLNFEILKSCHIYYFNDATLVFYTVREKGTTNFDHFIEIEVKEETIHRLTEEQAWGVITKYEKILEPVGVNARKRLQKSLFEMYRKEK
jgi:hypothetical protein